MIKVILFDADGVLITSPGYGSVHSFEQVGLDPALLQPFFKGIFKECMIGKKDLKEVVQPVLDQAGWEKTVDEFLHEWFLYEHVLNKPIFDLISEYRKKGIRCCLASNQEQYRKAYIRDEMKFGELLDDMYVACDLGVEKETGVSFFEQVWNDLKYNMSNLKKEEVLFWDDSQRSIDQADIFGFHTELYTDFDLYKKKMNNYAI